MKIKITKLAGGEQEVIPDGFWCICECDHAPVVGIEFHLYEISDSSDPDCSDIADIETPEVVVVVKNMTGWVFVASDELWSIIKL